MKRRLIGAIVLVSLAIIFLPMLLEHEPATLEPAPMKPIPEEPERNFDPSLLQDAPPKPTPVETRQSGQEKKISAPPVAAPLPEKPKPAKTSAGTVAKVTPGPEQKKAPEKPAKPPARPVAKSSAPAAKAPSGWVVQVASLSSRDSAFQLVKKLRRAGLDTMDPRPVTVNGKRFYRVQVGPEISRANAEKHLALVKRIAGTKGKVMRYP